MGLCSQPQSFPLLRPLHSFLNAESQLLYKLHSFPHCHFHDPALTAARSIPASTLYTDERHCTYEAGKAQLWPCFQLNPKKPCLILPPTLGRRDVSLRATLCVSLRVIWV